MASAFRGAVTEAFWCCHFERQVASEVSIRAYCREHGLAESSFYAWRREIDRRDAAQDAPSRRVNLPSRRLPQGRKVARLPGRSRVRSPQTDATVVPCSEPAAAAPGREQPPSSDRRRSSREGHAGSALRFDRVGLVAVEVVGDTPPPRPAAVTAGPTVEITCSGGVVVRLREEVSPEVLQRVIAACGQCHRVAAESVAELREVRSC